MSDRDTPPFALSPTNHSDSHISESTKNRLVAVDLFCGVGGLTHGLIKAGLEVVAGYDIDETCKYAYEENNEGATFYTKDIAEVTAEEISEHYPEGCVRVLAGCAPCQPYSSLTKKKKQAESAETEKGDTFPEEVEETLQPLDHFARLIAEVLPDIVSMENVVQLRLYPEFKRFIDKLEELGYQIDVKSVYCPDYGIPQNRRRLVLLASRKGSIALIEPDPVLRDEAKVENYIGNGKVKAIAAGSASIKDHIHMSGRLTTTNLNRIRASKPGGTWKDWDDTLHLACHKGEKGKSYTSVYGRMKWDGLAPTITTRFYNYGSGRFGHPEQDRAISLREGALLQTFPDHYKFVEEDEVVSFKHTARHIGNAVPVLLGVAIGDSIGGHLGGRAD